MTGFEVAPERIRAGGAAIGAVTAAFASRVERLSAELAGFSGAFGDDDIGMLMSTAYDAVSGWSFQCFQAMSDELLDAADDLMTMADDYDRADAGGLELFRGITGRLG